MSHHKLKDFYKSQKQNASEFTIEELEEMAEEIRQILVGPCGLSLPDYIKRVSRIPLVKLGHRRICSVKNEPKMEIYFPEEVWVILKERCDKVKASRFTDEDNKFLIDNRGRGHEWLSEKMYVDKKNVSRKASQLGVSVESKNFIYTPEILNFMRKNADKGAEWLSQKMGVSSDAIRNKCKRSGIPLAIRKLHYYTPEEDEFIRNNKNKGSGWIAEQLNLDKERLRERAARIGVKLPVVLRNKCVKYFTPAEDDFLKKNLDKGATWIAKELKRKVKSVVSRAKHKGWKLSRVSHRHYTPEDNEFIRENAEKGVVHLAGIFKITPDAIQKHAKRVGVKVKYVREKIVE